MIDRLFEHKIQTARLIGKYRVRIAGWSGIGYARALGSSGYCGLQSRPGTGSILVGPSECSFPRIAIGPCLGALLESFVHRLRNGQ
jgi:hypothetical protein